MATKTIERAVYDIVAKRLVDSPTLTGDVSVDGDITVSGNISADSISAGGDAIATTNYVDSHKPYTHASTSVSALSTLNGTWTAPYDGFFVIVCRANTSSGNGYVGIQDTAASRYVLMMTQTTVGGYFTGHFPVRKGNTYTTKGLSNANVIAAHVYYFRSDSD